MHVADAIETIFRHQIDAFTVFREVLLRERTALTQRNFPAIDACLAEHTQCVSQLEKLDREFKSILKQAGVTLPSNGVEHLLAALPVSHRSQLRARWSALLELVAECHDQNMANSRLVSMNRTNTEAALRILKGQISGPTATYSPDGTVSAPSTPSALATV